MSGSEGEEQGESRRQRRDETPEPQRTKSKGSSSDSQGGRGEEDDDQADEFEDEPGSQASLDAEQVVQQIENQRQTQDEPEGYDVQNYSPDDVSEWEGLGEIDANHGNSMNAKDVGVVEEGTRVVHSDLDHPSISQEDGERQMVGYEWMNEIAPEMTVEHNADFDEGWYANEVAPGVDAKDAKAEGYAEAVDQETLNEMAATQVIIGNSDAHQNNVRVDEDGNLHPFDLDRSAGDIDGEWVGALSHYDDTQDRILGELESTANALGVEMDREEVMDKARSMAAELEDMDPPEAASEWNSDMSETIQQNIQSLAEDASPVEDTDSSDRQANNQYNPDEVPDKRQGTQYEDFTSKQITNAAAYAMQDGGPSRRNWAEWQQFFDTMTDAEIEEATVKTFTSEIENEGWGSKPSSYEADNFTQTDESGGMKSRYLDKSGALFSRAYEDNPDSQREMLERVKNEVPEDDELDVAGLGASWFSSADVRREIYEDHETELESHGRFGTDGRFDLQFGDSHETRAKAFISNYSGSTGKGTTKIARASLMQYGINKETEIAHFNKDVATRGIEPTEEFADTITELRNDTATFIEEEHDGEVILNREVDGEITSNASAESWSSVPGGVDKFGETVMEARFSPGQVISTQMIEQHEDWGYAFDDEEEWTVLGGYLARNIPEESTATDYYDIDKDDTQSAD